MLNWETMGCTHRAIRFKSLVRLIGTTGCTFIVFLEPFLGLAGMSRMGRHGQLVPGALDRLGPIVEIAAHRPLAMIQIEARHACALGGQRDRHMNRRRRFACATFFIGKDNHVR